MSAEFGPKLTKSEYEILRAVPTSLNYTQVAEKTGFSVAYVSRKLKALKEKAAIHGVFDLEAVGLKEIKIMADYDPKFVEKEEKINIPFITNVAHLVIGKKDYLWVEAYPPKEQVEVFIESLGLKNLKIYNVYVRYVWRPDTAKFSYYANGYLAGDFEKIADLVGTVDTSQPRSPTPRMPDEVDLWLMAKLMQYPFTKISREAERAGIRQQVASYHLIRHVKPLWLYNTVNLRLDPDILPTKIFTFKVDSEEYAARLAASLVHVPYIPRTFVPEEERDTVFAFMTVPGSLEMKLLRTIRMLEFISEFGELAVIEKEPYLKYTIPFGKVVGGGRWIMDGFYQAIRAMSSPRGLEGYTPVYEILPLDG